MDILSQDDLTLAKSLLAMSDVKEVATLDLTPERMALIAKTPDESQLIGVVPDTSVPGASYQHFYIAPMTLSSKKTAVSVASANGEPFYDSHRDFLNNFSTEVFVRTPPMIVQVHITDCDLYYKQFRFFPIPKITPHIAERYIANGALRRREGMLLSNNVYDSGTFCFGDMSLSNIVSPNNLVKPNQPNIAGVEELVGSFFLGMPNSDLSWMHTDKLREIGQIIGINNLDNVRDNYECFEFYSFWLTQQLYAERNGFDTSTPESAVALDEFWKKFLSGFIDY